MEIVFDFDGTLADTWNQSLMLLREIFPQINEEDIKFYRANGARKTIARMKLSMLQIIRATIKVQKKQSSIIVEAVPFEGILELIKELRNKGNTVGIVSANSVENIKKWLANWGIKVDFVITSNAILSKAKILKDIKTENCIYIGDEVRDIEACKKAGVKIIAVTWGFNDKSVLEKAGPDWVVEEVEEIRGLLV